MNLFLRIDINIVSFILLVVVFVIAFKRLDRKDKVNRSFLNTSIVIMLQLLIETGTCIINGRHIKWLVPVDNFLHVCLFIIGPCLTYLWCLFTYRWIITERKLQLRRSRILILPFVINTVLVLSSPFTKLVFSISDSNVYMRGPFFFVPVSVSYLYLFYSMFIVCRNKKKLIKDEYIPLLLFATFPAIGGLIQVLFYGTLLMWSSAAYSFLIVFIYIQQRMIQMDSLTGAWTRSSFEHYVDKRVKEVGHKRFGIIFMDLDHFKKINDEFGHFEGDIALQTTVKLIKKCIQNNDIIARFGGDEFVILIETGSRKKLEQVVARIEERFENYNIASEKDYKLEYSYGYDVFDSNSSDIGQFLNYVDRLMYINKDQKRAK